MKPELELQKPPFSTSFLAELSRIFQRVFPTGKRDYLLWRLENMPDVTVFTSTLGKHLTGFKAGYAFSQSRYYSGNKAMVQLNHNSGLVITGYFVKDGKPNYIMQKKCAETM